MRALFVLLTGLFLIPTARADVTGIWQGEGEWTFQGSGVDCTMSLQFTETDASLKRNGGYFDCGIVALKSDPLTWEKQGGELRLDGEAAGTIDANGFASTEPYGDGVHVETKFTMNGETASYEERWINEKNVVIYLIRGDFRRKPSVRP